MTPLLQFVRGFAMGSADIVPGVSGGTVALVLGIYERLIKNIHAGAQALKSLVSGNVDGFSAKLGEVEWVWLLSLLAGVLAAVAALSSVIERLLNEQPVEMSGLFFGLVVASAVVAWRLVGRFGGAEIAMAIGVAVVLFLVLGLRAETEVAEGTAEVVTQPFWVFFLAGALAICAMILPGISGSFILVMIGMYTEVLGSVNERELLPLGAFAVGAVVGLALFSSVLTWLLERYHDLVIAAMIGLMVGSLRVLWPWPNGTHSTKLGALADPVAMPLALAAIGFAVVIAVDQFARRTSDERREQEPSRVGARREGTPERREGNG